MKTGNGIDGRGMKRVVALVQEVLCKKVVVECPAGTSAADVEDFVWRKYNEECRIELDAADDFCESSVSASHVLSLAEWSPSVDFAMDADGREVGR